MALPKGTSFSNIQRIIGANQNNALGNTVQSGVQSGVTNLNNNVNQAQTQFGSDVNNAKLNTDANKSYIGSTIGNITNATPQASTNTPVATNTTDNDTAEIPRTGVTNPGTKLVGGSQITSSDSTGATAAPSTANANATAADTTNPAAISTTAPTTPAAPTPTASTAADAQGAAPAGSFGYTGTQGSGANKTDASTAGFTGPTAGDVSKFGTYIQGGYTGPTQLANIQALAGQAQNLQNIGNSVNTQGGLQNLLQRYVGGPQYTSGEQNLDAMLLGQTGKAQLKNIAQTTQNIANVPTQAETSAEGQAAQAATENKAFGQDVLNQLSAAQDPITSNIQSQTTALNGANNTYQQQAQNVYNLLTTDQSKMTDQQKEDNGTSAIKTAATSGMITNSQMNQLINSLPTILQHGGDIEATLQQAFNYNPQMQAPSYTQQQVASNQQAAQLNALQMLAQNGGNDFNTYGGVTNPNYTFDYSKLPTYVTTASDAVPVGSITPPGNGGYVGDQFNNIKHGIQNPGDVVNNVKHSLGSFLCTELFRRGMMTVKQVIEMSKLFLTIGFRHSSFVNFYLNNAPKVVTIANSQGFDWSTMKAPISDNVLAEVARGRHAEASKLYMQGAKQMFLNFEETAPLWNDSCMTDTLMDKVLCIPKVITSKQYLGALSRVVKSFKFSLNQRKLSYE